MTTGSKPESKEGITRLAKLVWENGEVAADEDYTAQEVPIAFEYNCVSHAVMMATPNDLVDFAVGFSLSEQIIESAIDLLDTEIVDADGGKVISMIISEPQLNKLKGQRRALVGRTGCGVCGAETIAQALKPAALVSNTLVGVTHQAIQVALGSLSEHQVLNQSTGAIHAAAWCDLAGNIKVVREDVGRHNALDKLIGNLCRANVARDSGFILISSRASYEMVSKAAEFGAQLLVAVSGVTHLAVKMAEDAGLTLVGFTRPQRHSIYTHTHRLSALD